MQHNLALAVDALEFEGGVVVLEASEQAPLVSSVLRLGAAARGAQAPSRIHLIGEPSSSSGALPQLQFAAGGALGCFQDDGCEELCIASTHFVFPRSSITSDAEVLVGSENPGVGIIPNIPSVLQVWNARLEVRGSRFEACRGSGSGGCILALLASVCMWCLLLQ